MGENEIHVERANKLHRGQPMRSEEEIRERYKYYLSMANSDKVYTSVQVEFKKRANELEWVLQEDNQ